MESVNPKSESLELYPHPHWLADAHVPVQAVGDPLVPVQSGIVVIAFE